MDVVLALLLGIVGGLLAGLFGVGGGIVFVPALALGLGLEQVEAEATSLLAILPAVVAGTWRHRTYGNVRWRDAALLGVAAIPTVVAGAVVALSLEETWLRRLFGAFLLVVAAQLAWRARTK